jgi:hypothetical protein
MMTKTQAHVGTIGGLRGHSISLIYPWGIVGYGDDTWQAVNMVTGEKAGGRTERAAIALLDAEEAAERDQVFRGIIESHAAAIPAKLPIGEPDWMLQQMMARAAVALLADAGIKM